MKIDFETVRKLMNLDDGWGFVVHPGFNVNWGPASIYRNCRNMRMMVRKFGDTQAKDYFVLRYYRHRKHLGPSTDLDYNSGINEIIIPVPLTPRNLKNVINFFMQKKSSDFGEYLPDTLDGIVFGDPLSFKNEQHPVSNTENTNRENKAVMQYWFDEMAKSCFKCDKESRTLTTGIVKRLMNHIKKSMTHVGVSELEINPITNFLVELENNFAWKHAN